MSEADRIRRESMLKAAMMDASQPYPSVEAQGLSPAQYYQSLLSTGLPKEEAKQKTYSMMEETNKDTYNQSGNAMWPMEGEY